MRIIQFLLLAFVLLFSFDSFAGNKNIPTKAQRIVGAMTCDAVFQSLFSPSGYDMFGCKLYKSCKFLSIKEFFEKNRKSKNYEILEVVYNNYNNMFIIYYGDKSV